MKHMELLFEALILCCMAQEVRKPLEWMRCKGRKGLSQYYCLISTMHTCSSGLAYPTPTHIHTFECAPAHYLWEHGFWGPGMRPRSSGILTVSVRTAKRNQCLTKAIVLLTKTFITALHLHNCVHILPPVLHNH